MSFSEDQEIVLEIIKNWLEENDASYLAKEDIVVHWGNPTGDITKEDWVKYKTSELVGIIKATKVPVGIMKYCTNDVLRAACQEEGRTFICGVEVRGNVKPEYFNYFKKSALINETAEHKIATGLLIELQAINENILWADLSYIFEQALKYCKIKIPSAIHRNNFLRYAIEKTDFVERRATKNFNGRYTTTVNGKLVQYTCIKLENRSGIKVWTKPEMRSIILKAVNGIKK
jgi:hypothetical protein